MNPVLFDESQSADNLTVYSKDISEIGWEHQLVGLTDSGFLYVDRRVPRMGYYEFYTAVLPWSEVQEVTTGRRFSLLGILLGIGALFLAFAAFHAGWIEKNIAGPDIILLPLIYGLGGLALVLGPLRNRIVVTTRSRVFKWTSGPLSYKGTLPLCREAAEKARAHQVQLVDTHA